MTMRGQMVRTVEEVLDHDDRVVLFLGDIGVYGFRHAFEKYPQRVYNIGILEQATISMAAGLALLDMVPIVHTIAPFIVERGLEQLKLDFCFQKLGGNFISVGASYDYAALGCSHHCPGDAGILKNVPGMEIVIPGTSKEFDSLFQQSYSNGNPTYFRLSEQCNCAENDVSFGKATVVRKGKDLTIIAIGPMLDAVVEASYNFDVTILYYTTVAPFDKISLRENASAKILLCEPYYSGVLASEILEALFPMPVTIDCIGVPLAFLTCYGHVEEHTTAIGLTGSTIQKRIERLIG